MSHVFIEAIGIRIAGHIQPMASPAFAVCRRSQQAINQAIESIRTIVGQVVLNFLGGRRQPDQIKRYAAEQGPFIRL